MSGVDAKKADLAKGEDLVKQAVTILNKYAMFYTVSPLALSACCQQSRFAWNSLVQSAFVWFVAGAGQPEAGRPGAVREGCRAVQAGQGLYVPPCVVAVSCSLSQFRHSAAGKQAGDAYVKCSELASKVRFLD